MSGYAANRASASKMIGGKGQPVTITRRTPGAYNTATGTAAITETTQTGTGVVLPLAPFRKTAESIVQGDQQLLLSALDNSGAVLTAPVVDDRVTLADGTVATITAIDPLAPSGLVILYDCVIRRAA